MGEPTRRPGGRSARVRAAVLEAALDEAAASGLAEFRIDRVAERAGVNKTTIYRRWAGKEALLADALMSSPPDISPPEDTGSLRGDLVAYGERMRGFFLTDRAVAITRALTATSDPTLMTIRAGLYDIRRRFLGDIIDRAIERGELTARPDIDLVTDLLFGSMFRVLVLGPELPADYIERLTDLVIDGLRGGTQRAGQPKGPGRRQKRTPPR